MFEKSLIVMPEQAFAKKDEVIHYLTHLPNEHVLSAEGYERDVTEREATFATYTIDGVAIPHAKTDSVTEPFVIFARLKEPVPWGTKEEEKASIIFLMGVPKAKGGADLHLKLLARLSMNLMHDDFRNQLKELKTVEEIHHLLKNIEEAFSA